MLKKIDALLQSLASPSAIDITALKEILPEIRQKLQSLGVAADENEALAMLKESIRQKTIGKARLTYGESSFKDALIAELSKDSISLKALIGHQDKVELDFKEKFLKQPAIRDIANGACTMDVSQYRIGQH